MTAIVAPGMTTRRRGPGHWSRSFTLMLRWQITRMRLLLPVTIMLQVFTGAGMVLGFSLLYRNITDDQVLFLATGAVVINLVVVGLVMGPQLIAQQRLSGSYDWFASLPVPRSSTASAWVGLNAIIAIPGLVAALLAAVLRFDIELSVSWIVFPACTLVLVCGALLGYAYAHAVPHPRTVNLISQVTIFFVFGFSPIAYPVENLPDWLATIHLFLPFMHMGNVVRAGLTTGLATDVGLSFLVLTIWTVAAALVATWSIGRRH